MNWVNVPFNSSYAPGPKDFDFDINNISVTEERDQAVDFSDSYYDLTQALMVLKGSPIEHATTMDEIKDSVFGAQIGTTSLTFINTVIQPTTGSQGLRLHERREGRAPERDRRRARPGSAHRVLRGDDQHAERRPGGPVPERRASTSGCCSRRGTRS